MLFFLRKIEKIAIYIPMYYHLIRQNAAEKMDETPEQSKDDIRLRIHVKDDASVDEFTDANVTDLSFPWPLVHAIQRLFVLFPLISKHRNHLRLQFVLCIICILCIVSGFIGLQDCSGNPMLPKYFIIQGALGLFVVLVHLCKIVFK
jgi:hypothetical protein